MADTAATNYLSDQITGNLHRMPKGLLDRVIAKSVYVDATLRTITQDIKYRAIFLEAPVCVIGGYLITDVLQNTTINIGDATDDDEFGSAMSLNSNDTATAWDDITLKFYDADNEISIVPAATLTTAKFWILALLLPMSKV
jgi:hypothetical protein